MGPTRSVSEINGDFSRKSQKLLWCYTTTDGNTDCYCVTFIKCQTEAEARRCMDFIADVSGSALIICEAAYYIGLLLSYASITVHLILLFVALCVFICAFWFVCVFPFFVSLGSWVISLTVLGTSVTNLNEPPRALATSTITWVRS